MVIILISQESIVEILYLDSNKRDKKTSHDILFAKTKMQITWRYAV